MGHNWIQRVHSPAMISATSAVGRSFAPASAAGQGRIRRFSRRVISQFQNTSNEYDTQ
jgi:hypothetical protein